MDITYEKAISRLEEIVKKLESGSLSLEESLKLYEEGAELSLHCHKLLSEARLKIVKLNEDNKDE